jgi:DNA-binding LacI/PurR family transcriptional regulator
LRKYNFWCQIIRRGCIDTPSIICYIYENAFIKAFEYGGSFDLFNIMNPKNKRSTIYDVARLSGLSISTVSRVLNSHEHVEDATRARVLAAIDQLGFVPKAEARARALMGTHRFGVITPFFTAPSFVQRLRGVAAALSGKPYELVIYPVDSLKRLEGYLSTLPITHNLDGLIIISLRLSETQSTQLLDHHLRTVLIENRLPGFNSVEIDDANGGRMAAEYFMRKGRRCCAFLGDSDLPDYAIHPAIKRLAGFRQALEDAGIHLPEEYIRLAPFNQDQTRRAAYELLHLPDPPDAIFVATDFQAMGVLKVAHSMGLRVPQDLAIVGFDDLDMSEMMDLTTIRQHLDESGRVAVDLLIAGLNDPIRPVQQVTLPLKLVERDTC